MFGYTYIQYQSIFKRTVLIFVCFFSRHILWFFTPLCGIVELSKHFSRHLLRLLPIFLSALFIEDGPSPWQPWALTEQEKRSVVPVRSDFWPKESNGLHKWAVVTKANISLCTVHCTVQCTVRCLHSSSWRSLRKTYDSVTFWGCPERQGWCVRFFWVGEWRQWCVRRRRTEQLWISWF